MFYCSKISIKIHNPTCKVQSPGFKVQGREDAEFNLRPKPSTFLLQTVLHLI